MVVSRARLRLTSLPAGISDGRSSAPGRLAAIDTAVPFQGWPQGNTTPAGYCRKFKSPSYRPLHQVAVGINDLIGNGDKSPRAPGPLVWLAEANKDIRPNDYDYQRQGAKGF